MSEHNDQNRRAALAGMLGLGVSKWPKVAPIKSRGNNICEFGQSKDFVRDSRRRSETPLFAKFQFK